MKFKTPEQEFVRRIHVRAGRLDRLIERDAPSVIIEKERDLVRQAIHSWTYGVHYGLGGTPR